MFASLAASLMAPAMLTLPPSVASVWVSLNATAMAVAKEPSGPVGERTWSRSSSVVMEVTVRLAAAILPCTSTVLCDSTTATPMPMAMALPEAVVFFDESLVLPASTSTLAILVTSEVMETSPGVLMVPVKFTVEVALMPMAPAATPNSAKGAAAVKDLRLPLMLTAPDAVMSAPTSISEVVLATEMPMRTCSDLSTSSTPLEKFRKLSQPALWSPSLASLLVFTSVSMVTAPPVMLAWPMVMVAVARLTFTSGRELVRLAPS